MKASVIYTRKRMGLDNNVWLTMLLLVIICSGLLAYKVADNKKTKPCAPLVILVNGSETSVTKFYTTNDYLFFKAGASMQTDDIVWDFDDHSETAQGYTVSHNFKQQGTYAVTATVDGYCVNTTNITVVKPVSGPKDSSGNTVDNIIGNGIVHTGVNAIYETTLPATVYTWTVENNSYYQPRQGKQTAFKFKSKGIYTISLMLDNNSSKVYRKNIVVTDSIGPVTYDNDIPKPTKLIPDNYPVILPKNNDASTQTQQLQTQPQVQPAQPQPQVTTTEKDYIGISNKTLMRMLDQVKLNQMHVQDFDQYFYLSGNTIVYTNNDSKTIHFSDLCQNLTTNGSKITIDTAIIRHDPDNPKHVISINVYYNTGKSKEGFFNKINPFKKKN